MSIIKIKGRADPLVVDYVTAKRVKQRKFGDLSEEPPISKASSTDLCDLGDVWCGEYSRIVEIELNDKPRAIPATTEEVRPMTEEDRKVAHEFFEQVRKEMGWAPVNKLESAQMTLTRSGLEKYKKQFGRDYQVKNGTKIIEDI